VHRGIPAGRERRAQPHRGYTAAGSAARRHGRGTHRLSADLFRKAGRQIHGAAHGRRRRVPHLGGHPAAQGSGRACQLHRGELQRQSGHHFAQFRQRQSHLCWRAPRAGGSRPRAAYADGVQWSARHDPGAAGRRSCFAALRTREVDLPAQPHGRAAIGEGSRQLQGRVDRLDACRLGQPRSLWRLHPATRVSPHYSDDPWHRHSCLCSWVSPASWSLVAGDWSPSSRRTTVTDKPRSSAYASPQEVHTMRKWFVRAGLTLLAVFVAAGLIYHLGLRGWCLHWGTTPAEARATLPGDELFPVYSGEATHAITIQAPPQQVWPWLMQIGQDRSGFYSYTFLENLAGCEMPRVERLVPEW